VGAFWPFREAVVPGYAILLRTTAAVRGDTGDLMNALYPIHGRSQDGQDT